MAVCYNIKMSILQLLLAWLLCSLVMSMAFVVYWLSRQVASADLFWGPGIGLVGIMMVGLYGMKDPQGWYVLMLVWLWAIRLSAYLWWTRFRVQKPERRLDAMINNWGKSPGWNLYRQYLLQAALQTLVALPLLVLPFWQMSPTIVFLMSILALFSLGGEALADWQLYQFTQDPKEPPNTVCQRGLWYYSRHPNAFFDILFWLSIALMGIGNVSMIAALIGVVVLGFIFIVLTIPITESYSLKKRLDYALYQKQVSILLPWMRKK